jgi:hypothetical protein
LASSIEYVDTLVEEREHSRNLGNLGGRIFVTPRYLAV